MESRGGQRVQGALLGNLIIGNGLIGRHIYYLLRGDALLLSRKEVDLSKDSWELPKCSTVYICAVITSTKYCEEHREESQLVNITNTVKLAERLSPVRVVWISSERVFDGSVPFRRVSDEVCPTTEYGRQKVITERLLLERGATVVRFSKVIGWSMPLFDSWVSDLRVGVPIFPFRNIGMSPLPVLFVARYLSRIGLKGLHQVSALEDISYDRIALYIANYLGVATGLVQPVDALVGHSNTTLESDGAEIELGLNIPEAWDTIRWWCENKIGK